MHTLISNDRKYPDTPMGWIVDVRDVAKAHVQALTTPPLTDGRDKRIILYSKACTWPEIAAVVRESRPELSHRLPDVNEVPKSPAFTAPLDRDSAEEVFGMTYIPWEKTILDNLDVGLQWEQKYAK
jgi:nucleoside-diphosphate-sugar epimerase